LSLASGQGKIRPKFEHHLIRRILLNIHIYAGLLCFSGLLVLGISTLIFNHTNAFTQTPTTSTAWSQPFPVDRIEKTDGKSAGESRAIRGENNRVILRTLRSFAVTTAEPDGRWTDADTYHAHFTRLGAEYEVDVHRSQRTASVTRKRPGVWATIRDLHGSVATYTGSVFAGTWGWYTEICVFVVVAQGITGVYLLALRRKDRRMGFALLGIAGVFSVVLMLVVTFRG
jgi:hypothetical protein